MAARLAAQRRTKTDIAALDRTFEWLEALAATGAEGAVSDWVRADGEFHLLIARMSRNPRLLAAVEEVARRHVPADRRRLRPARVRAPTSCTATCTTPSSQATPTVRARR